MRLLEKEFRNDMDKQKRVIHIIPMSTNEFDVCR